MAGNAVIGALRVNLGIDSAAFDKGLQEAKSSMSGLGATMKTAFLGVAAAAAGAIAGISIAIKGVIDDADDISKVATKIGIPIEELSQLKYVADLAGVSFEGLQTGVRKLSQNMAEFAKKGGGGASDAFKGLGVSVKNTDGSLKSSSAVIDELADKFAAMPDGVQKTALATKLFGKAGADLIPLLNGGAAALKEARQEADAFGLTLSAETGVAAENFNDNLSRISYAGTGVVTALTAALLPALVVVSDALVETSKGLISLIAYLPTVAEYAAVAGGSLALMLSPAILSAISTAVVAIGTGLVGAIRAVTIAMAANPLGALAVGISIAVTAIYAFRDEIKQAIGVDVVQVTRDAANTVINSFVLAYENIKATWAVLPQVLGDVVYATAANVVGGVESMVNGVIGSINDLINTTKMTLRDLGKPVDIAFISPVEFSKPDNPYAGAGADLQKTMAANAASIMAKDNFAGVAAAATSASTAVKGLSGSYDANAGSAGKVSEEARKAKAELERLKSEGQQVFDATRTPLEEMQIEMQRLNKLLQAGVIDWDTYMRATSAAQDNFDKTKTKMSLLGDIGETIGQTISRSFRGLIDGSTKVKDILLDLTDRLADLFIDNAFQALLGGGGKSGGSSGGGGLGSIFSGIGKLFGFANGGSFGVGGSGGIDSQLVAFRASPNETVSITKPGQELGGSAGGQMRVTVGVDVDGSGNLIPFVRNVTGQAISEYDRGNRARTIAAYNEAKRRGSIRS